MIRTCKTQFLCNLKCGCALSHFVIEFIKSIKGGKCKAERKTGQEVETVQFCFFYVKPFETARVELNA